MNHYDKLYSKGGFKYSSNLWLPRIKTLQEKIGLNGLVLDAPCGDGFWSKLLTKCGCIVTSADISKVGVKKANGIIWDLDIKNNNWIGKFDWVFCRGISHIHHKDIRGPVFANLITYATKVLVIYSTNQSSKYIGNHFHHTRKSLDSFFEWYGLTKSFMQYGYYHAILEDASLDPPSNAEIIKPGHPDYREED